MNSSANGETEELSKKLDLLIGLFVSIHEGLDDNEKIMRMSALGLNAEAIGPVLGMTPNAVAIRISRMRKRKNK